MEQNASDYEEVSIALRKPIPEKADSQTAIAPRTRQAVRGGRPRATIDWTAFDALCIAQCTLAEIVAHFSLSEDTIERAVKREHGMGFADYFRQKRKVGFVSLRRKQWELAMGGNVTMLIFLGKQWLGQSDKQQISIPQTTIVLDL